MTVKHHHELRIDVVLKPAWQRRDAAIERDAELFWRSEGLLPAGSDVDLRLSQLCLAAYENNRLIGLTTARIQHVGFLGVKLVMLRVAVSREKQRSRLATYIQAESRELLEQWSAASPEEEVMGMGTVLQNREFDERGPSRALLRASGLAFIGWTANGEQMRVAWFEHGRIPVRDKDGPLSPPGTMEP